MTDDYKERIIKWLTGNYEIEQSNTDPLFKEFTQIQTTLNTYIETIKGYIQGRDGKGNELDIGFLYGLDINNKSVIVIVDNEFNIIQVIDEYNTGTDFSEFYCLNIDNSNGNIYGVDKQGSQYRFILLNNFLIKTPVQSQYEVKLRNDYFITFTDSSFTPKFVEKRPADAFYVIIGEYIDTSSSLGNYNQPAIATYKIEVGATNEFNDYYYVNSQVDRDFYLKTYNIIWSGEDYNLKLNGFTWFQLDPRLSAEIYYQEFEFNETINLIKNIELSFTKSSITEFENNSDFIMNNENSYIVIFSTEIGYSEVVLYKILDNSYEEYQKINQTTAIDTKLGGGKLIKRKNQIFYFMYLNTTEDQDTSNINFTIEFGTIANLNGNPYILKQTYENLKLYDLLQDTSSKTFNISSTYNLYTYNLLGTGDDIKLQIKQIYNSLNYNFEDYADINSLLPNSAWLYNDNKIIYARNLYNKTINGNSTISTLEVPNMMLNEISITPQQLLGATNGVLIEENSEIVKNVYEDLFINFYNTLIMQNQNTQDYITNLNGATRLNNSISGTLDYNDILISKIKINYIDESSVIKGITVASKVSQFVYNFNFQVYVDKPILNIQLISNDENTIYQTIELNTTVGNYYSINQKIEIGG